MKEPFELYLNDNRWLMWEKGWQKEEQSVRESLFTLGNGYLGSRGIYEEIPVDAYPGTYIAGVYDATGAHVTETVNAPNPIDFRIVAEGEKIGITAMDVLFHQRVLDMSQGLLARKTIYSNSKKHRFNYQSLRFFSMYQKHIGVMRIFFTPMDEGVDISIESAVNDAVRNKGIITEGRKKHFHIEEFKKYGAVNYLCVKTFDKDILIVYTSQLKMYRNYKIHTIPHRTFDLHVNKGETVSFTRYFSIHTTWHISPNIIRSRAINTLRQAVKKGFDRLLKENSTAWEKKWKAADITIRGDHQVDRALRFNIYHMLIVGNNDGGLSSIGARTLSGEGYRGHVFWDTEIYLLPFYIYNLPHLARGMLLYRYNRLEQARRIAQEKGYRGALFAWESADSGEESTPSWHKDFDGKIIQIYTMQREHHISADIAYAVCHYYNATDDHDFMVHYGLEIIIETARFWVSRVQWNNRRKVYEIREIIGPDEFHENVNNNAYTNAMAQWNISAVVSLAKIFRKRFPKPTRKLFLKLKLTNNEIHHMHEVAKHIANTRPHKNNLIEEFEGYFKKKQVKLKNIQNSILPEMPTHIPLSDFHKTQLVKQADVLMLLYLLPDMYSATVREKNYYYYLQRTLHKSSLSTSMHAIIAAGVGDKERAYQFFCASLFADLKDIYGNTFDGIHAASLGGTWQAVVNGFGGIRVYRKGILSFDPNLPTQWNSLKFKLKWKGLDLDISIYAGEIAIFFKSIKIKSIKLIVYQRLRTVFSNRINYFTR